MRYLEDNTFDVTITDPPYSKRCQDNLRSGSLIGKKSVPNYELEFDALKEYGWINHLLRATKRWVAVFCTLEDFGKFELAAGEENYVRSCIWYKPNSMGQLTRDRPAAAYEGIALLHKNQEKLIWEGKGSYGIWKCNGTRGIPGRHPNQKPDDLCTKLIHLFTQDHETVFDPFAGSGAIGRACKRFHERHYVGWERDSNWVERANAGIKLERFDPRTNRLDYLDNLCSMAA
jgi:DNA modification methylase